MNGRQTMLLLLILIMTSLSLPALAQEAGGDSEQVNTLIQLRGGGDQGDGEVEASSEVPEPDTTDSEESTGSIKIRKAPGRAIRVSEIESRIVDLTRNLETSEVRLRELADRVISGKVGRASATVTFRNEMGSSFKLVKAVFALDGAPIFSRTDESGELSARDQIELFNGSIVPGEHRLSVNLEYRGHGYGIFSYLKGYRFKVRSSYTFTVEANKSAEIRVMGYEKGDQDTALEERPDIRYVERLDSYSSGSASAPPPEEDYVSDETQE